MSRRSTSINFASSSRNTREKYSGVSDRRDASVAFADRKRHGHSIIRTLIVHRPIAQQIADYPQVSPFCSACLGTSETSPCSRRDNLPACATRNHCPPATSVQHGLALY